ncbi:MAG: hypothetical protein D6798_18630 [Deltaproteobacteria bacterium]|nr:MAG: hypothetical protein D6798_18630 [Deltaproteobacteria bacterium]
MSPLLLLCGLSATPARAGDFMDVWISTAFEDTNVLAGPEAMSPSPNFVERGNAAFFENYESRTTDDISRAQLVLYKRSDSFFSGWWTEAAFVLRYTPYLDPDQTDPGTNIEDDGSYVRLVRDLPGDDHTLSLTGYAVDSDRFRLGYSYDLSWGGREIFSQPIGAAPGVRLQWERQGSYAFVGAKTAIMDAVPPEDSTTTDTKLNQTFYAALAGGGIMVGDRLKLEANAGSFQQGQITSSDADALYGAPIVALGVAGQVAFRSRPEVDFIQSADLRLYRNEPESTRDSYIRHRRIDGVGVLVQAEVDRLSHNLMISPDSDSTVIETGYAGDLQSLVIAGSTVLGVDLVYKDLPYIVFNVPGIVSQQSIGDSYETTPQFYGRFKVEHWFQEAHVTPGFGVGLMQPATYTTQDGKTVIQIDDRNSEQIPDGQAPTAILSGITGVQVDLSDSMVAIGEVLYTLNNNKSNPDGDARVLAPANERNELGFNLILRARF